MDAICLYLGSSPGARPEYADTVRELAGAIAALFPADYFASTAVNSGLLGMLLMMCLALPASAQNFQTKAKQALLMDYESGTVLYQKNADQLMPPASMAKLMTMEVVFNAIKTGSLCSSGSGCEQCRKSLRQVFNMR